MLSPKPCQRKPTKGCGSTCGLDELAENILLPYRELADMHGVNVLTSKALERWAGAPPALLPDPDAEGTRGTAEASSSCLCDQTTSRTGLLFRDCLQQMERWKRERVCQPCGSVSVADDVFGIDECLRLLSTCLNDPGAADGSTSSPPACGTDLISSTSCPPSDDTRALCFEMKGEPLTEFSRILRAWELGVLPLEDVAEGACAVLTPTVNPCASDRLDSLRKPVVHSLSRRLLTEGVGEKKRYEVERAGRYIHARVQAALQQRMAEEVALGGAPSAPPVVLVDVGAGQGYLSAFLAVSFGYDVVALEKDGNQVHGSIKRSRVLEMLGAGCSREKFNDVSSPRAGCMAVSHMTVDASISSADVERGVQEALQRERAQRHDGESPVGLSERVGQAERLGEAQPATLFALYSLHACGALSSHMIRLFAEWKRCILLVNIGCCYNLLADERVNAGVSAGLVPITMSHRAASLAGGVGPGILAASAPPADVSTVDAHPSRYSCCTPGSVQCCTKTMLMAACQAPHRWLDNRCAKASSWPGKEAKPAMRRKRSRPSDASRASQEIVLASMGCGSEGRELREAVLSNFDRAVFQVAMEQLLLLPSLPAEAGKLWVKCRREVDSVAGKTSAWPPCGHADALSEACHRRRFIDDSSVRFANILVGVAKVLREEPALWAGADAGISPAMLPLEELFERSRKIYMSYVDSDAPRQFALFWVLRALVGHATERFLLGDRCRFLEEAAAQPLYPSESGSGGVRAVRLERLFDIVRSPRCTAVVAWR